MYAVLTDVLVEKRSKRIIRFVPSTVTLDMDTLTGPPTIGPDGAVGSSNGGTGGGGGYGGGSGTSPYAPGVPPPVSRGFRVVGFWLFQGFGRASRRR